MTTNYIFVTGGVVSSLGKGIAAASLAAILEARGLNVTIMKLDPYINVDPGTMSPIQHGKCSLLKTALKPTWTGALRAFHSYQNEPPQQLHHGSYLL